MRAARRTRRRKFENTFGHRCVMSPGLCAMHTSLERVAAAPCSQGMPSLRHPVTGEACNTDAATAAALAAITAANARAPAVLLAMYSSASSTVHVGSALSPAAVQRGVAQGCPLSPLPYAIFQDPVLQDMQALLHPDLLWVGPAAARRKLVGQAYVEALAGIAATQQGLQRVVQAVHLHCLRRGRLLNVPMSVVMVFGTRSVCARLDAPELWWGDCRLPTTDTIKYLGLRLESSGGWAAQQAAGAANGWAALHHWLPVLRCQHLSAATKLLVLRSRCAMHVLRHGTMAPGQAWCQHDCSADPGRKAYQRHPQTRLTHGFLHGPFCQPGCDAYLS